MIQLSRTQDEEVGDGTTSVIILGKYSSLSGDGQGSGIRAAPAAPRLRGTDTRVPQPPRPYGSRTPPKSSQLARCSTWRSLSWRRTFTPR